MSATCPNKKNYEELRGLLLSNDVSFWSSLYQRSQHADEFDELLTLSTLRKRAIAKGIGNNHTDKQTLRLALIGGYSLYPLQELICHLLAASGYACELFVGDFDNYVAEMMDASGGLYGFNPDVVFVLPSEERCKYHGKLSDPRETQQADAIEIGKQLLEMCRLLHERTHTEIVLGNFMLPAGCDLGPYRSKTLGSDWSFRKLVNLELGLNAPPFVHICDVEFLSHRRGALASRDARSSFESKQPCAPDLMVDIAREVSHIVTSLRGRPKKVLVLDLDNTLWGGVIGDDGLEGIDLGDISPRGQAFKAFQKYLLSLTERGVLLAVCSKNDHDTALEPFLKHPEMVLRAGDIVSFKANWEPKSENIKAIAADLGLGLDSFVFVDDNPAEIEIMRQFVPEVARIQLGPDPADHVSQLQDSRLFEPSHITKEDSLRTEQYKNESKRQTHLGSATDMDSYLESLDMVGSISEFIPVDLPRISQLINKSNQFNLTTRRRTEAEVLALLDDPNFVCFSMRLKDRFGDHGLIAVVIGRLDRSAHEPTLEVDTWLMSCRVLSRQVEEETINEIVRVALLNSCSCIRGLYRPTFKNGMVRDLYPRLGFRLTTELSTENNYECDARLYRPFVTKIRIDRRAYESNASDRPTSGNLRQHFPGVGSVNA